MKSVLFKIKWWLCYSVFVPLSDHLFNIGYISPPIYFVYWNELEQKQKLNFLGRCWLCFWKLQKEFIDAIIFIGWEK